MAELSGKTIIKYIDIETSRSIQTHSTDAINITHKKFGT